MGPIMPGEIELLRRDQQVRRCLNYAQSSIAQSMQDSSVSYVSLTVEEVS
jgi:predicted class III extradiol MEMO1 family dioxygenase